MELDAYQTNMYLIVVIFAEFFHRFLDVVIVCVLEILVYVGFLIGINHLFDEIVDIDLRTREHYGCLQGR